ncbi:MAG: hypothetical protein KC561_04160 [Myxococcales bacterium]|nr:hypothetical protein [Myxococcales bacterium]
MLRENRDAVDSIPDPVPDRPVRRPAVFRVRPRLYRIVDARYVPVGQQDMRNAGMACVLIALGLFLFLDIDFIHNPIVPAFLGALAVLGVAFIVRAPLRLASTLLCEVDLAAEKLRFPQVSSNGIGPHVNEYDLLDVHRLLFARRDIPVANRRSGDVKINGYAVFLRMGDDELVPIIEASFDQDRTYYVAQFLSEALNLTIKQVGKGWSDPT